ncbi:MAG TPA: J domain-containing protein, partial [Acidimicrobiales bacterium]|nr:J domain-containing protein [Acidimicrobiales bacterium]
GARAPAGAGARRTASGRAGPTEDWFDFDDLFADFLGSRGRAARPSAGADQEAEVVVTVDEAYRGTRRSLTLSGPDGQHRLDVTIPAGVVDGQRIRLAGQGAPGAGGGPPGDLYLVVRIAPHHRYHLEGRDIHVDLPVAPWEAALGASVPVETPGGEVTVRVPAGSSCGRHLRLRHRGLPNPRGEAGDLLADVLIRTPRSLSDNERRLFEELAKTSTFNARSRR